MDTVIHFWLTIIYIVFLLFGIHFANRHTWKSTANFLLLVMIALLYDNGILALGRYMGESELLKNLHLVRYVLHACITPLLVLFSWNTLKRADIRWASNRFAFTIAITITILLIMIELLAEVRGISLEIKQTYGVLSYEKVGENNPPIMVITVSAILLLSSIIIWRKQKWGWFFAGTAVMILASSTKIPIPTNTIHQVSEAILLLVLLLTKSFQDKVTGTVPTSKD